MLLIAHRGNTDGPRPEHENDPYYLTSALHAGFDVEVDLWCVEGILYFGHDQPQYGVSSTFFIDYDEHLWIHCKNYDALYALKEHIHPQHYFFHDRDLYTLTSCGKVWTFPGALLGKHSIAVMPETLASWPNADRIIEDKPYGICSDYVRSLRKSIPAGDL